MSEAGMSNLEILKTGALVPAQYMGATDSWGQIKEGYEADFVLVEQNPLLDLKTLQKPVGVVIRGKWIGREELQSQLDRIEKNHLRNWTVYEKALYSFIKSPVRPTPTFNYFSD